MGRNGDVKWAFGILDSGEIRAGYTIYLYTAASAMRQTLRIVMWEAMFSTRETGA